MSHKPMNNYPIGNKSKLLNNSLGFTLTEVMIAIGIASVSMMTFSSVMFQTGQMVNQIKISGTCNSSTLDLLSKLQDDNALLNSFLKDATLADCIPNRNCLSRYTAAATPTTPTNMGFSLWDKASMASTHAVVDATDTTSGFTRDGSPCTTFGTNGCSVKPKVQWKPISDSQIVLFLSHDLPPALVGSRSCAQVALPIDLDKFRTKMVATANCVGDWGWPAGAGWIQGACSATCGGGSQTYKEISGATGGGASCSNVTGDINPAPCNPAACAPNVACVGAWSACSAPCAGGATPAGGTMTYSVTTPASGTGASCSDVSLGFASLTGGEVAACNTTACPPPSDCVGSWGACSVGCGGGTQTYTVSSPATNGGLACSNVTGDSQACNSTACPVPVNCVGSWGACSALCADATNPLGGTQIFTETVAAANGGAVCVAANGAVQPCNTVACPGPVNCVGTWSACTSTQVDGSGNMCGDGTSTFVITTPASGGGTCAQIAGGNTHECFIGHCRPPSSPKADFEFPHREKVSDIADTNDGGEIIVGRFTTFQGVDQVAVAKIKSGGLIDVAFNPVVANGLVKGEVYTTTIQSDQKILIGGKFTQITDSVATYARGNIARLTKTGLVDPSFANNSGFDDEIYDIAIQTETGISSVASGSPYVSNILVGGRFHNFSGVPQTRIAQLDQTGQLMTTFNIGSGFNDDVHDIEIDSAKKIYVGGRFSKCNGSNHQNLARLNQNGTIDPTFINPGFNDEVHTIKIDRDGDIIVGGKFTKTSVTVDSFRIAKLNPNDGSPYPQFNFSNVGDSFKTGSGFDDDVFKIDVDRVNNDLVIGGKFTSYNGAGSSKIERIKNNKKNILNLPGSLDVSFSNSEIANSTTNDVIAVRTTEDGRSFFGGAFQNVSGPLIPGSMTTLIQDLLIKTNASGSSTPTGSFNLRGAFALSGAPIDRLTVEAKPDGNILVAGGFDSIQNNTAYGLAQLNSDGNFDSVSTFNSNIGLGFRNITATPIIAAAPNKIIINPDNSFKTSGGNLYPVLYNGISRCGSAFTFNADGTFVDTSASKCYNSTLFDTLEQTDGNVLIRSWDLLYNYSSVDRWLPMGNKDAAFTMPVLAGSAFGAPPIYKPAIYNMRLQSTGKIIVSGDFLQINGIGSRHIARLNNDGSADATFLSGTGVDTAVNSIYTLSDDSILVTCNGCNSYNGSTLPGSIIAVNAYPSIFKLNSNGLLQGVFNTNYVNAVNLLKTQYCADTYGFGCGLPVQIVEQPDGKLVIGAYYVVLKTINGQPTAGAKSIFYRMLPTGAIDPSFKPYLQDGYNINYFTLQPDGKILAIIFNNTGNIGPMELIRLNADGTPDFY